MAFFRFNANGRRNVFTVPRVSFKIGNIARHATSATTELARERTLTFFILFLRLMFQAPLRDVNNGKHKQIQSNARSILVEERLNVSPRERIFGILRLLATIGN